MQQSTDGNTYLSVVEGNNCNQIKIDGVAWSHPIGQAAQINPGKHVIECNGEIGFNIPAGVIFKFDYWGP